jgi:hypothetical protein
MASSQTANQTYRVPSSLASNNAALIKVGAGRLYGLNGLNATAGVKYIKFYDVAAIPNPAVDVPKCSFAMAASVPFMFDARDLDFKLGMGIVIVVNAADTDNTAIAAADVLGLNVFLS